MSNGIRKLAQRLTLQGAMVGAPEPEDTAETKNAFPGFIHAARRGKTHTCRGAATMTSTALDIVVRELARRVIFLN